ncbi:MAG: Uncharacterised protein [Polaribacter sp. SA4-10]|nr:MAG: Uncharacterised protein [Polaribacter sp. SA4-10]
MLVSFCEYELIEKNIINNDRENFIYMMLILRNQIYLKSITILSFLTLEM